MTKLPHPAARLARAAAPVLLASGAVAASGCSEGFAPASLIRDARVIAVTANPPEAVPGDEVTLTPVVVAPTGDLGAEQDYAARWWRCPDTDSDALGDFEQCSVPAERREVGAGAPFVDAVPADLLGELPTPAPGPEQPPTDAGAAAGDLASAVAPDKLLGILLGYWRVVGLSVVVPPDADAATAEQRIDAFKRIPIRLPVRISDADPQLAALDTLVGLDGTPRALNTNPGLTAVLIHEDTPTGATVTRVRSGDTYFFDPIYDSASLEDYLSLRVDLTGLDVTDPASLRDEPVEQLLQRFEKVQRCEVPVFSWFVTHGRVRRETSLDESVVTTVFDPRGVGCPPVEGEERAPEVEYTAPTGEDDDPLPEDGVVRAWVVMRDGRGGTATRAFTFTVE